MDMSFFVIEVVPKLERRGVPDPSISMFGWEGMVSANLAMTDGTGLADAFQIPVDYFVIM